MPPRKDKPTWKNNEAPRFSPDDIVRAIEGGFGLADLLRGNHAVWFDQNYYWPAEKVRACRNEGRQSSGRTQSQEASLIAMDNKLRAVMLALIVIIIIFAVGMTGHFLRQDRADHGRRTFR